jgi:hypothetical protein
MEAAFERERTLRFGGANAAFAEPAKVVQTALKFVLLMLSLFALAVPTTAAMRRLAVRPASRSLLRVYMRMQVSFLPVRGVRGSVVDG